MTIHHSNYGLTMHDKGACKGYPPEWWDMDSPYDLHRKAARVCLTCPIRRECLAAHKESPRALGVVRAAHQFSMTGRIRKVPGLVIPD